MTAINLSQPGGAGVLTTSGNVFVGVRCYLALNGSAPSWTWTLTDKPTDSNAVMEKASQREATFAPDVLGDYEVSCYDGTTLYYFTATAVVTVPPPQPHIFIDANNVSFGTSGNTVTAIAAGGGGGGVAVAAGTQTATSGTVFYSNANGLTFGMEGSSVVTGSYTVPGATVFSNSNGLSFGLNGSTVTGSYTVPGATVFSNSNGLSFGLNGSTITGSYTVPSTAGLISAINVSGGTTSRDVTAMVFSNSNGFSFGMNGSTITGSYTVPTIPGATIFSNSNNVSFGLNGSTVTATATVTYPAQTNQQMTMFATGNTTQSSTGTSNASSLVFRGAGIASIGITAGSVVVSVPAGAPSPVNFSAGTTSGDLGSVVFSNSNGISFGLNGSTMTASIPAYTALSAQNRQLAVSVGSVPGQNSVWLAPFRVQAPVSASTGIHMVSITGSVTSNQTNTVGLTWEAKLYQVTGTNESRLDSIFSTSMGFTFWNSGTASVSYSYNVTSGSSAGSNLMTASVYGNRLLTFNIGSVLGTGVYAWGFRQSTSSAGASSVLRSFNAIMDNPHPQALGFMGSATNQSIGYVEGGTYSVTSGAMPVSFLLSEIKQTNNVVPYFKMGAV